MITKRFIQSLLRAKVGILFLCLVFAGSLASAGDLKEGTEINKDNLDQMLSQTYEGKTIESMLPNIIKRWIKEYNLNIYLRPYETVPVDPRWLEATKKFSGQVQFDPATREVTGYTAGQPFPNLKEDDPNYADKLIWNLYLTGGWPRPEFQYIPKFGYIMIDGDKGFDRSMLWGMLRIFMAGRLTEPHVLGDGKTYYQQVLLAREPYDIRGLGSYRIRYRSGNRQDDGWYYVRSMRRTRRISGGAWFDPIGGTDQLNDELSIFSAYPTWFPKYKVLGKGWVLGTVHGRWPHWTPKGKGGSGDYPNLDMTNAPYWNPIDDWEPRPVYIIEAEMPPEHVYSKRIYYIDAECWVPYYSEAYNKRGEFVKLNHISNIVFRGVDAPTSWGVMAAQISTFDWSINHGTVAFQGQITRRNPPDLGVNDANLRIMEQIAQGRYKEPGPYNAEWDMYPSKGYTNFAKDPDYKKCQDLAITVDW